MIWNTTKWGDKVHYRPENSRPENGYFKDFVGERSAFIVYTKNPDWEQFTPAITSCDNLFPGWVEDLPGGFYVGEKVHDLYSGNKGIAIKASHLNEKMWIETSIQYAGINQHYNHHNLGHGWNEDQKIIWNKPPILQLPPLKEVKITQIKQEPAWPF